MARKKAFTLVELLVVIAIIALLMSILMPALGKAKRQAEFIVCKTNLGGYGKAETMYLQDHNGTFTIPSMYLFDDRTDENNIRIYDPYWQNPENVNKNYDNGPYRWPNHQGSGTLWPYLGQQGDINMCPTFYKYHSERTSPPDPGQVLMFSYSKNAYLGMVWHDVPEGGARFAYGGVTKDSQVDRAPADICLFSEEGKSYWGLNDNVILPILWLGNMMQPDKIGGYHKPPDPEEDPLGGFANVVYLDGHVAPFVHIGGYDTVKVCWPGADWNEATKNPYE